MTPMTDTEIYQYIQQNGSTKVGREIVNLPNFPAGCELCIDAAKLIKDEGNARFKQLQFDKACMKYDSAASTIEWILSKRKLVQFLTPKYEDMHKTAKSTLLMCLTNLALSHFRQNQHQAVVKASTRAIDVDNDCEKALYRRAVSALEPEVDDPFMAKKDLKKYLEVTESINPAAKEKYDEARRRCKQMKKVQKSTDADDDDEPPDLVDQSDDSSSDPGLVGGSSSEDDGPVSLLMRLGKKSKSKKKKKKDAVPVLVQAETDSSDSDCPPLLQSRKKAKKSQKDPQADAVRKMGEDAARQADEMKKDKKVMEAAKKKADDEALAKLQRDTKAKQAEAKRAQQEAQEAAKAEQEMIDQQKRKKQEANLGKNTQGKDAEHQDVVKMIYENLQREGNVVPDRPVIEEYVKKALAAMANGGGRPSDDDSDEDAPPSLVAASSKGKSKSVKKEEMPELTMGSTDDSDFSDSSDDDGDGPPPLQQQQRKVAAPNATGDKLTASQLQAVANKVASTIKVDKDKESAELKRMMGSHELHKKLLEQSVEEGRRAKEKAEEERRAKEKAAEDAAAALLEMEERDRLRAQQEQERQKEKELAAQRNKEKKELKKQKKEEEKLAKLKEKEEEQKQRDRIEQKRHDEKRKREEAERAAEDKKAEEARKKELEEQAEREKAEQLKAQKAAKKALEKAAKEEAEAAKQKELERQQKEAEEKRAAKKDKKQVCSFGFNCTKKECLFRHPDGRRIDAGAHLEAGMDVVEECHYGRLCTDEHCKKMHTHGREVDDEKKARDLAREEESKLQNGEVTDEQRLLWEKWGVCDFEDAAAPPPSVPAAKVGKPGMFVLSVDACEFSPSAAVKSEAKFVTPTAFTASTTTIDDIDDSDLDECVICMDGAKEYVMVPCGHLALCSKCVKTNAWKSKKQDAQECPTCRHQLTNGKEVIHKRDAKKNGIKVY